MSAIAGIKSCPVCHKAPTWGMVGGVLSLCCDCDGIGFEAMQDTPQEVLETLKTHHEGIVEKLQRLLLQANLRATDIEAERDALREQMKALRRTLRFYSENSPYSDTAKADDGKLAQAALAATEVKS